MLLTFKSIRIVLAFIYISASNTSHLPNVVVFLVDDFGWSDVGYHSDHVLTPNIDTLAADGIVLNQYYSHTTASTSRTSLLTGVHPIHTGLQNRFIMNHSPAGAPLHYKLWPQYLKQYNYSTHMVGKWGLGFARREYTPTYRGFDSFVGFWTHSKCNYNHTSCELYRHLVCGDDSRHNTDFTANGTGVYSTHHFTDRSLHLIDTHNTAQPLFLYVAYQTIHHSPYGLMEAPPPHEFPDMFGHIESDQRKTVARMIYSTDQSIGAVVERLHYRQMLDNSILVFVSDNSGRSDENPGTNWPFKNTPGIFHGLHEGNIRTPALIWSPLLTKSGYVSDAIVDVTDLLPTVLEAIDGTDSLADERDIYGRSQWSALSNNDRPVRQQLIYNVNPVYDVSAIRWHDWKLMQNSPLALTAYRSAPVAYSANASTKGQSFKRRQTMDRVSCKSYDVLSRMDRAPDYEALSDAVVECGPTPVATDDANDCPKGQLCLYNLRHDPCEYHNLIAETDPEFVRFLWNKLVTFNGTSVPPLSLVPLDPRADPSLHNNRWTNWLDTGEQADQVDGSIANKVEL